MSRPVHCIKSLLDSIFDVSLQTFQLLRLLHRQAARMLLVSRLTQESRLLVHMEDRHLHLLVNSEATQASKGSRALATCSVGRVRPLVTHLDLLLAMVLKVRSYTLPKEYLTLSLKLKPRELPNLNGIQFGSQWLLVEIRSSL